MMSRVPERICPRLLRPCSGQFRRCSFHPTAVVTRRCEVIGWLCPDGTAAVDFRRRIAATAFETSHPPGHAGGQWSQPPPPTTTQSVSSALTVAAVVRYAVVVTT